MFTVRYGGTDGIDHTTFKLSESNDLVAVRTHSHSPVTKPAPLGGAPLSGAASAVLEQFDVAARFPMAGVEVLRTQRKRQARALRDEARAVLKQEPDVRFAGRVLHDPRSKQPVLYTENLFVKFEDSMKESACKKLLRKHKLTVKRALSYARNAYFVEPAKEGTGLRTFEIAEAVWQEDGVALCHPELIRQTRQRNVFSAQWHLDKCKIGGKTIDAHCDVVRAWTTTRGEGTVIAIIDDGVDVEHEEFGSSGKVVAPLNASVPESNPNRTNARPGPGNNHGTACAGVACADGLHGAIGVAPRARLMPIRLVSGLGSQAEADAFIHAARNGADVISCSWGPTDGRWWKEEDPAHNQVVPLPDSTRLAIDWAIRNGRSGKGCVVVWAAGNGNESVDNDGYASYGKVVAVGACNDDNKRSVYSDKGAALWCCFPSNDFGHAPFNHPNPKTTGIWTTDRSGADGYNRGLASQGDEAGHYTNSFGGTSSAAPGVAGIAALVLAHNPELRWDEVKDLLRRASDRVDTASNSYDADGHSPLYGYGRVNARKAVELARPPQPAYTAIHTAVQDVAIKDQKTVTLDLQIADTKPVADVAVSVELEHTYIGDLVIEIRAPGGTVTLQSRTGGGADNLNKRYDTVSTPGLADLTGKNPKGTWTLAISDKARRDTGTLRRFSVELVY